MASKGLVGWTDADLSAEGQAEAGPRAGVATAAGRLLKEKGFKFDIAFTPFGEVRLDGADGTGQLRNACDQLLEVPVTQTESVTWWSQDRKVDGVINEQN
eukprot:Skav218345  [mRNA]  locus=scaffold755:1008287:1011588:- [translate_table: standard]